MKLKEWGLMRHKPRKTAGQRTTSREASCDDPRIQRDSSATVGPELQSNVEKPKRWRLLPEADLAQAEPTFMGLLRRTTSLVQLTGTPSPILLTLEGLNLLPTRGRKLVPEQRRS